MNLSYHWSITGAAQQPVLVHISTKGSIAANYGFTPLLPNTYNLSANTPNVAIAAYFGTNVNGGYDQRTYGLQTGGNFNWGVTRVASTDNFTQQNGGTSTVDQSFSQSFDLWVTPNQDNAITLQSAAFLYPNTPYVQQYATEHIGFSAFLDPVITIDAAYAGNYALQTSYIPTAVPEPSATAMTLLGLGLIGALAQRRRRNAAG